MDVDYFAYLLLVVVLSLYELWLFYLAWTHLEKAEAEGKLSTTTQVLAWPVKTVGLAFDTVVNFTIGTLVFIDLPREATVSSRFRRYLHGGDGWRKTLAMWACVHMLDAFDIDGDHCGVSKTKGCSTGLADGVNNEQRNFTEG